MNPSLVLGRMFHAAAPSLRPASFKLASKLIHAHGALNPEPRRRKTSERRRDSGVGRQVVGEEGGPEMIAFTKRLYLWYRRGCAQRARGARALTHTHKVPAKPAMIESSCSRKASERGGVVEVR